MDLALVPPRHHAAIGRLFKRLDPISGRRRGRPATFRIHEVVSRCVELLKEAISENAIAVTIQTDPGLPAHGYEQDLQAALLNIIDNAVYWLSTVSSKRTIDIAASYDSKDVVVNVSNNGPTLGQDYIPRLFSAGFTLKAGGTGLGLAIAREAMRGSKGDIAFAAGTKQRRAFYRQVEEEVKTETRMSVVRMCASAGFNRAGYYRFLDPGKPAAADMDLRDELQKIA